MKSYTDIKQSRKLTEILPIESADMSWVSNGLGKPFARTIPIKGDPEELCGCWSLAALLKLIPNFNMYKRTIECRIETINHLIDKACDPIDAAFEMVCWLKENNEL